MQGGLLIHGWDTHQPGNRQIHPAALINKGIRVFRENTCFLDFFPGIDLNKQLWAPPCFLCQIRNLMGQLEAIKRVDGLEQIKCLLNLVGLQRPDQMQLDTVELLAKRRPAALRLLHPVLTEYPLSGLQDRTYRIRIERLGDCNQVAVIDTASGPLASRGR